MLEIAMGAVLLIVAVVMAAWLVLLAANTWLDIKEARLACKAADYRLKAAMKEYEKVCEGLAAATMGEED